MQRIPMHRIVDRTNDIIPVSPILMSAVEILNTGVGYRATCGLSARACVHSGDRSTGAARPGCRGALIIQAPQVVLVP
jgi:hypothetical protein